MNNKQRIWKRIRDKYLECFLDGTQDQVVMGGELEKIMDKYDLWETAIADGEFWQIWENEGIFENVADEDEEEYPHLGEIKVK